MSTNWSDSSFSEKFIVFSTIDIGGFNKISYILEIYSPNIPKKIALSDIEISKRITRVVKPAGKEFPVDIFRIKYPIIITKDRKTIKIPTKRDNLNGTVDRLVIPSVAILISSFDLNLETPAVLEALAYSIP